jgi:nicotinate-nucleotide adenylyltransferase
LRVGLFGGTFDPIHNGHLHVIRELISRNVVDQLLVVPAGEPRLRENAPVATGADRRQMCQLAIDTVEAIAATFEGATISLILGTDAFEKIDQWHRADELKKMVEFIVIDRPNFPGQPNLAIDALSVSATDIRSHKSDQIPAPVAAYIKEHNLYASK